MNSTAADVIILGAGLTGLTLAHSLQEQGRSVLVLEARDRVGGRIHTLTSDSGPPVEMGATWYFPHFTALHRLMTRLGVRLTEQFTKGYSMYDKRRVYSHGDSDMFRIKGGTRAIVDSLHQRLDPASVILNTPVTRAQLTPGGCLVTTETGQQYTGRLLVSTLPPQLLHHSVQFSPELPDNVQRVMATTHTWMGDAIKAAVSYPRAWWRDSELSGGVVTSRGAIAQLHDQSDQGPGGRGALVGFLDSQVRHMSREQRREAVMGQLVTIFGDIAAQEAEYEDTVWGQERWTMPGAGGRPYVHSNVGHSLYQTPLWGGRLYIGGTETSPRAGGFMEGAVTSANNIAKQIMDNQI